MAKKDGSPKSKKEKSESAPQNVDLNVGGDVNGVVSIGNNNVIHNYFSVVEKNTQQNDPDYWNLKHPYPMPPNFTGRIAERAMLTQWLNEDKENHLFILRALGGFGKSALTWHWLTHDVNLEIWRKVVFWSFSEGDASFEHFIEETLKYLKLDVPQSKRDQVDALLKAMQSQKVLLIMDGFERVLRAYSSMSAAYQGDEELKLDDAQLDCVDINAELFLKGICSLPNIKGKALMTTRLSPSAIKPRGEIMLGCREFELTAMQKADAVEFFRKQGIQGNRGEIESACEPYGYHPLSLRLLAGRILKDFENPADIIVVQKLKIDGDIIQQKHHVLEVSYNSLPEPEKKLLGQIACFRSPVEMDTLVQISKPVQTKGIFGFFKKTLNLYAGKLENDLRDLVERGILHRSINSKSAIFDLHPIVRRFAYDRLTATSRTVAHKILINYFDAIPKSKKVDILENLSPVIELYHHMVRAGRLDEAFVLHKDHLIDALWYQFSAYQTLIELLLALFLDGEDKPPRLKKGADKISALNELADIYSLTGQPYRARLLYEMANKIYTKDMEGGIFVIADVALNLIRAGLLQEAERKLRNDIALSKESNGNEFSEASDRQELGRVLSYRGAWREAEQELNIALDLFLNIKDEPHVTHWIGVGYSYFSLRLILMARSDDKQASAGIVFDNLNNATKFMRQYSETVHQSKREYIRNYWLFGAAYRANGDLIQAEENLSKAISICRQISLVEFEADILLDLARLRYDQKNYNEAKSLAEEALTITERCSYILQGADVNLFLAQYALEQEKDKAKAKEYAESALRLAYCDGPPYYYKVAYEEAFRLLEELEK